MTKYLYFWYVDRISWKFGLKSFGHWTLKLVLSQEVIDVIFFSYVANSGKLNVTSIIFGWEWS